jgi:hypothetical protein
VETTSGPFLVAGAGVAMDLIRESDRFGVNEEVLLPLGIVTSGVISRERFTGVEISKVTEDEGLVRRVGPSEIELDEGLEVGDEAVLKPRIL